MPTTAKDLRPDMLMAALDAIAAAYERDAAAIRKFRDGIEVATHDGKTADVTYPMTSLLLSTLNNGDRIGHVQHALHLAQEMSGR